MAQQVGQEDEAAVVGLRMRLRVSPEAAALLDAQSRIHGWWHNYLVGRVEEVREHRDDPDVRNLLYSPYGLRNLLTQAKAEYPFLTRCWTYSLQCVAVRLRATLAMTRTEHRRTRGLPALAPTPWAGWPHRHRWSSHWASLEYHALTGGFTLEGRTLWVSFGRDDDGTQIRASATLYERLPPFARPASFDRRFQKDHPIRGLRIVREHGEYFAVFSVRRALTAAKPLGMAPRAVSLDPHHYSLATAVDSAGTATRIPYPPGMRALDRRVDDLAARRDRCVRTKTTDERGVVRYHPSERWTDFDRAIQQTRARREARVRTYLYELANWLCKEYEVIAIGDYTPGKETSEVHALNRWTHNQSLVGRLRGTVAWVARRSGRTYLTWPEADTTRTCHACGHVWPGGIPTGLRYYLCPGCGRRWRRNENNAATGLRLALRQVGAPLPGSEVLEVTARRTWRPSGLAPKRDG